MEWNGQSHKCKSPCLVLRIKICVLLSKVTKYEEASMVAELVKILIIVYFIASSTMGCCCTVKNLNLGWKKSKFKMLDLLFLHLPVNFRTFPGNLPRWEAFSVTDGWIGIYLPSGNLTHSCSSTRYISNFGECPIWQWTQPCWWVQATKRKESENLKVDPPPGKWRKTRWDTIPSKAKKTRWHMLSQPKFCTYTPPMHWREIRQVGGPGCKHDAPYEEKMWREMVQNRRSSLPMLYVGLQHQPRLWIFCYTASLSSR